MTLPDYIKDYLSTLESNGFQAFVVGGCVRDYLLNLNPEDWDICTSATPAEMQKVFSHHTVIPTGIKHGTVTVLSQNGQAEITTFRTETGYRDARHPDCVTYVSDIYQDLARRDFTVNAMAYSPKTDLIDPYEGKKDLEDGILRCVGSPELRIQEDALRILRALRFSATYGLQIEPNTSLAITRNIGSLNLIAKERIWAELKKMLVSKAPGKVFLAYPEILQVIFGDSVITEHSMNVLDLLPRRASVRLAGLLAAISTSDKAFADTIGKLKTDGKTKRKTLSLLALKDTPLPSSLSETRRMLGRIGMETFEDFIAWNLAQAELQPEKKQQTQKTVAYITEIQKKNLCYQISDLAVSGQDLLSRGVPPGKEVGILLQKSLDAVIDHGVPNEKKAILNHLFL